MKDKPPVIVILGAGFAGVYAYFALHGQFHGKKNKPRIFVIDKHNYFLFTPLLHEVATGSVDRENIVHPVRETLNCCLDEFYMSKVFHIDLDNKLVSTKNGDINYDYLLVGLGAVNNYFNVEGAKESTYNIKDLKNSIALRNHVIDTFERASFEKNEDKRRENLRIVIIGGGPTGVELAGEMEELVYGELKGQHSNVDTDECEIYLINGEDQVLSHFSPKLQKAAYKALRKKRVKIINNTLARKIEKNTVWLSGEENMEAGTIIWAAGVSANPIKFLPRQEEFKGRIRVNEFLQLSKNPEVFIAGDMACCLPGIDAFTPHSQTAQVAIQQGWTAGENIARLVKKRDLKKFQYHHRGDLVSVGQWMAVGEIKGIGFHGKLSWLLWRGVYLSKMVGRLNKIKVFMDWFLNIFFPRDTSKL